MSARSEVVAVVTGASRGVGKGVALGLAAPGVVAYLVGRTLRNGDSELPGSLESTARELAGRGATPIPVACDLTRDEQTQAAFERIRAEHARVDLLVNAAWGGYEQMFEGGEFTWPKPFWEQPSWRFDAMFTAGVRATYVASALAAPAMLEAGSGLIVNVSSFAAGRYLGNAAYGSAKAATDKLSRDMAHELRAHAVAVVSLYPGLVRTESVMQSAEFLDLSNSESPEFQGRAVSALLRDPERMRWSGRCVTSAELAREYGFRDLDGSLPKPLEFEDA